ncbi:DUF2938 domain-containing protein [Phreatobacter aquaticus]|uniref:DUF2938 domain-containing protein n=1 Tax=Phreatobacter aquaticus TaxID=2570229 RepID=A0A4D7QDT2_9HYPH|nr:DUF2938 domain-containing protein [Phreatobacter aquaticus]QCK86160.1 DUF2938 domain-containing protein [Phreatobacter aquaticus]
MWDFIYRSLVMGIGATALIDIWSIVLQRVAGIPPANWAMVGRWVGHLARGTFAHEDIGKAEPVANELAIGWVFHYAVGVAFGAATLILGGAGWAAAPTILPPMIIGWVTVGAGWFILSPGLGGGLAASKRPNPNKIRILNVVAHTIFGFGMYLCALAIR